jgi:hypothetical protein
VRPWVQIPYHQKKKKNTVISNNLVVCQCFYSNIVICDSK